MEEKGVEMEMGWLGQKARERGVIEREERENAKMKNMRFRVLILELIVHRDFLNFFRNEISFRKIT